MKAYIDSHVPINSIIRLIDRYDFEMPSDLNIDNVVESTFKAISHNRKERKKRNLCFWWLFG